MTAKVTFVKSARKDYPEQGIKKGESYYWWKFAFQPKKYSKTKPRRSQLESSHFLQELYDFQDTWEWNASSDLESQVDDFVQIIDDLRDMCEESLNNMPDHLQDTSDVGVLLNERIDALEQWADEVRSVDLEVDEQDEESQHARILEIIEELENIEVDL